MPDSDSVIYLSECKICADPKQIPAVRARFIDFLLSLGIDDAEKEGWKLTFTEAVNNAIEHGSMDDASKSVSIRWWSNEKSVWLETQDDGAGPDEEKAENPSLPEDPLAEGGRGLFIIHNFSDNFLHWRSKEGYIARIGKTYSRLNNVMPQNSEMDAILDELSDCYESLSLYDRMAETLIEDERVDKFIESSLEIFMDARDYDAIDIEVRDPEQSTEYEWIATLDVHAAFGRLHEECWQQLEDQESISWRAGSGKVPFTGEDMHPVGGAVPIYVNDLIVGLIAIAFESLEHTIRSNDLRNLRALADIIGIALSRAVMQRERDERKRLATEINIATKLQHQLLPIKKEPPSIAGYDLFIDSISALEIAGDYVEVRQNSSGEYLGCIIDVMGKGVSAAILAGIFRSQFLAFSERGGKLVTFIESANKALETQLGDATMFITAFVFKLNNSAHELSYVAAGHPPAILFRKDGASEQLESKGPPIGLFKEIEYAEETLTMQPDDRLLIVTDGLYEFSTSKTGIFGWDAMVEWFEENKSRPPETLWGNFHRLIVETREKLGIEQEDDETILILTRKKQ
jgi:serine phosphatase RsbU (regulator of sigma subunit)/anti-sigma regulatory factor (Ser/Thr protein kinase)